MRQSPLSRVENLIRKVVEEPFTWLAGDSLDPFRLATYLVQNHEALLRGDEPARLAVYVNAEDFEEIAPHAAALQGQVADYITLIAERHGQRIVRPVVQFRPDEGESPHRARVVADSLTEQTGGNTEVFVVEASGGVMEAIRAADAFLIVQGRRHVPLDRPVTHIGRRMDNDIVLDTPSVSRQHAQIRWRQRYFVLYDVSGHGRTAVNGMPAREHILRPGDVISLSDIMLVYGEGRNDMQGAAAEVQGEELDTTQLKPGE